MAFQKVYYNQLKQNGESFLAISCHPHFEMMSCFVLKLHLFKTKECEMTSYD